VAVDFSTLAAARTYGFLLTLASCAAVLANCASSSGPPLLSVALPGSELAASRSAEYQILFSFGVNVDGLRGVGPLANLIDVGGALYGTTPFGGMDGYGTVFSITKRGKEKVVHSFVGGSGGSYPVSGLLAVNGTLYGTTAGNAVYGSQNGNGTVFSLTPSGANFQVLHTFSGSGDGAYPMAGLVDVNGTLYGTTAQGGAYGNGTVFSISTSGVEAVLHSFDYDPDGENPLAGLIDANGTLYGTTQFGGRGGGTVFSITTSGAESVLYSFQKPADGAHPVSGLVPINGTLYGTTPEGGAYGEAGTVFSVNISNGNEVVLHSFDNDGSDGANPMDGMIAVKGALYGTTQNGGAGGVGTIFRITTSGTETVLHSFGYDYANDGAYSHAALLDVKGKLFGTTPAGGISEPSCSKSASQDCDYGTVFALTP
jgi:uncharacterized repeat protein (TIGR03803 family)